MDDTTARPASVGDFTGLDDPGFLAERARVRGLLEHQPENSVGQAELARVYAAMTEEFCRRARIAWQPTKPENQRQGGPMEDCARLSTRLVPAQLLAVEVLLADPEMLGNDALEGDLYILRDQLRAATSAPRELPPGPRSQPRYGPPHPKSDAFPGHRRPRGVAARVQQRILALEARPKTWSGRGADLGLGVTF
jgi:hypothetical protein